MCVLLITRQLQGVGRWACKPVNHASWDAVVTPTDRPKSVCNRRVIEFFVVFFLLSLCPFDISVGVKAFVIGLSQISFLLSLRRLQRSSRKCLSLSEAGAAILFSDRHEKHKLGKWRWDLASSQVPYNSVQLFLRRSPKCEKLMTLNNGWMMDDAWSQ